MSNIKETGRVRRVVIVGGGTAGWLAACLLAAKARRVTSEPLSITLIEAPNIPTIGVGEGTWPTIRATLSAIGLDEDEVLRTVRRRVQAGVALRRLGHRAARTISTIIRSRRRRTATQLDLVSAWRELAPGAPFAFAVCAQPAICEARLAPRQRSMPPYAGALNYAYHLDATKLAAWLSQPCGRAAWRYATCATKWSASTRGAMGISRRCARAAASASRATCSSIARAMRRC